MSGYILIYDKSGIDPFCLSSTYEQVKNVMDDRSYRIEYFSHAPTAIEDFRSNPVRLFVIPGGTYTQMADELKQLAPRIRQLVIEDGSSYLGICAGAIAAACRPLLMYMDTLCPNEDSNLIQELQEVYFLKGNMHLKLYSGHCCYFDVQGGNDHGTQKVKKVSCETDQSSFPLYFHAGVFFPGAETQADIHPLLKYDSYRFSGCFSPRENVKEVYDKIVPVAAVTQKIGKGRLVLSGVHSEIGPDIVKEFSTKSNEQEKAKSRTISSLYGSVKEQNDTMRDYLSTLGIAIKRN